MAPQPTPRPSLTLFVAAALWLPLGCAGEGDSGDPSGDAGPDEAEPGVALDVGLGWSQHHPFVAEDAIEEVAATGATTFVLRAGKLFELQGSELVAVEIAGVASIEFLQEQPAGVSLLGSEGQVRYFSEQDGWLTLPDAPVDVSDVAFADKNTAWLAGKYEVYRLSGSSWQRDDDFPGWGTILNVGWHNRIEAASDGHVWTTSAYYSSQPFYCHFDGTNWTQHEGLLSDVVGKPGGEALLIRDTRIQNFSDQQYIFDTDDYLDYSDGLPDYFVPIIYDVELVGDALYIATSDRIHILDSAGGRELPRPAISEPGIYSITAAGDRLVAGGAMGLFDLDLENAAAGASWIGEPSAMSLATMRGVIHAGDDRFLLAGGTGGLFELLANDRVVPIELPESGQVELLTRTDDGSLWLLIERENTDAEGIIRNSARLWRRSEGQWESLADYGYPDSTDLYRMAADLDGSSVLIAVAKRLERISATGTLELVAELEGISTHFDLSRAGTTLWTTAPDRRPTRNLDGVISEFELPTNNFGSETRLYSIAAAGSDRALGITRDQEAWILGPQGVTELGERVDYLIAVPGGLPLAKRGDSLLTLEGDALVPLAETADDWYLQQCASSAVRLVCVGHMGRVLSRPLP